MGRELRMVPKNWEHPRRYDGRHAPMFDGSNYHEKAARWVADCVAWENGTHHSLKDHPERKEEHRYWWEWDGPPPDPEMHMLIGVPESERTHFMLYESTSEGTPCNGCPVFETLDELCAWAEKHATTFASFKTTAEEWKRMLSPGNFVCAVDGNVMFL